MSGSFGDMLSKAKAYLADQTAKHDITEQPVTIAAGFDNKENLGTISANTTPKLLMYHRLSTKGKLQKAAQAPGQSKLPFMVQKQP
ncbi:TPA: hypothetical protein ACH3X3_008487 [Trebouxia sp. C0006]